MPNFAGKQNLVLNKPIFHTENNFNLVKNKDNSMTIGSRKKKFNNPEKEKKVNTKNLIVNYKLNEGSETTIADSGTLGLGLTITEQAAGTSWDNNFGRNVYELSATNNAYLTIGSSENNNIKKLKTFFRRSFTISYWAKFDSDSLSNDNLIFSLKQDSSNHIYVGIDSSERVIFGSGTDTMATKLRNNIKITDWNNYTFTYNKRNKLRTIYINGKRIRSDRTQAFNIPTPTTCYIGYDGTNATEAFIYDFRIYSKDLKEKKIRRLYKLNSVQGSGGLSKNNLKGHWMLNEGTGDTANDKSGGTAYDGTLTTSAMLLANGGPFGGPCVNFDGTDDHIVTGNVSTGSSGLNITSSLTISCWAKSDNSNWNNNTGLISKEDSFILNTILARKIRMFIKSSSGFHYAEYSITEDITEWHLYTGTYDGSTIKIYVDGILKSTESISVTIIDNTNRITIGSKEDSGSSTTYFDGKMWDVRVYNTALSADEIYDIYSSNIQSSKKIQNVTGMKPAASKIYFSRNGHLDQNGELISKPLKVAQSNLVLHFEMNDLTDPILRQTENIIIDSSGNDYDGTLESFNSNSVWTNNDGPDNGPCINFDGGYNSYIKLSNTFYKYFHAVSFTVCFWVKFNDTTENAYMLEVYKGSSTRQHLHIGRRKTDHKIRFGFNNDDLDSNTLFNNNSRWYHLAFTFSSSSLTKKIYADGVLDNSGTAGGVLDVNPTTDLYIGRYSGIYLKGKLTDYRVYNRELTADEIGKIYHETYNKTNYSANYLDKLSPLPLIDNFGLQLHLTGQDNSSTGYVTDYSGNLRHADVNGVTYDGSNILVTGKSYSLAFDGTNDYLDIDGSESVTISYNGIGGASPFSFCSWIKRAGSGERCILSGDSNNFKITLDSSNKIRVYISTSKYVVFNTTIGTSKTHITILFDTVNNINTLKDACKLYVNGSKDYIASEVDSNNEIKITNSSSLFIGAIGPIISPSLYFSGNMDDIRIYNRALTSDEIKKIYNGGNGTYDKLSAMESTIVKYDLTYGIGTTVFDNSGNIKNITLSDTNIWNSNQASSGLYSLNFDGSDDYGTTATLSNQSNITLDMSIKPEANYIGEEWGFDFTGGASEDLWTTDVAHGLSVGDKIKFVRNGGGATGYAVGVDYYVVSVPSTTTCTLSLTSGGTVVEGSSDSSSKWQAVKVSEIIIGSKASGSSNLNNGDFQIELERKAIEYTHPVGLWKLDEGSGSTANDKSGNENNGTLQNSPTWSATGGPYGGPCIDFDGTDDHITLPTAVNSYFTGGNSFTISVWVYSTYTSGNGSRTIFSNRHSTSNYGFTLFAPSFDRSANKASVNFREHSSEMLTTSDSIETDKWFHITYTHKTNEQTIYINGVQNVQETNSRSFTNTPGTPQIGRERETYYFDGKMSDVRIYNRALSATEISKIYLDTENKVLPKLNNYRNNLVGHWKLNENDSGSLAYDSTDKRNNGVLTNSPTWSSFGGPYGGPCVHFDGSSQHIVTGSVSTGSSGLNITSSITISCWAKSDNSTWNSSSGFVSKEDSFILNTVTSKDIKMLIENGSDVYSADYTITEDITEWHLYTGTYDGSTIKIYVDGILKATQSTSTTINNNTNRITIGSKEESGSSTTYFDGKLSDVRVYNCALNASEVFDLYNYTSYKIKANLKIGGSIVSLESKFLSFSNWNDVSFVYMAGQFMELYINGILASKKKLSTSQTLNMSNALVLGSKDLNGTRSSFYNGRIGGLKIYNKRLTEKEIKKMVSKVNNYILRIQPYNPKNVKADSTSLMDLSGNHNVKMNSFGTSFDISESIVGRKIVFDGSNDYLSIESGRLREKTHKTFTITGWIKPENSDDGTGYIILHKYHTTTAEQKYYKIVYDDTNSEIDFTVHTGSESGTDYTVTGKISQDSWSYITCICEGSGKQIILYINGKYAGAASIGTISKSDPQDIEFGRDSAGTTDNFYKGEICDFRFYECILDKETILDLMHEGYSSKVPDIINNVTATEEPKLLNGLDLHYNGIGNIYSALDNSGSGNYGVLYPEGTGTDKFDSGKYNAGLKFDGTDDMILTKGGPKDSLVGLWILNEGTGTTAKDKSGGTAYDGTLTNSDMWLADRGPYGGPCVHFNGSSHHIVTGSVSTGSSGLNITSSLTISCWAKSDNSNWNSSSGFVSKEDSFILNTVTSSKDIKMLIENGSDVYSADYTITEDITEWHLYTGSYDGSTIKIYVDGILKATQSTSTTINNNTNRITIGSKEVSGSSTTYFDGKISDARIYSRALTADEIYDIYSHPIKKSLYNDFSISTWVKFDNNNNSEGVLSLYDTDNYSTADKNLYIYKQFLNNENQWFFNLKGTEFSARVDASQSWNHLTFIYGYGYEDVTDGLVGYWKLNEASGTEAYDSSGNNNSGTLTNSPTWLSSGGPTTDVLTTGGTCLDFDGSNNQVLTSNVSTGSGGFNITSSVTLSCWAKSDNSTWNSIGALISKEDSFMLFLIQPKNIRVYAKRSTGWAYMTYTITDDITDWHLYTGTYDGFCVKVYFDGNLKGQYSISTFRTIIDNNNPLTIGTKVDAGLDTRYFDGKMSDVRVYNRALTADEIKTVYNSKLNDNKFNKAIFYNGEIVNSSTYTDTNTVNKEPILFDTNAFILGKTPFANGTAQAGTSNSITLASGSVAVDDYYNNASITITGGTGEGQTRIISDYTGSSKVATVSSNWTVTPSSDSTYTISFMLDGTLDDFRVYNRALSKDEAELLYNNSQGVINNIQNTDEVKSTIYTSNYLVSNTNRPSNPLPTIARDNLVIYYDFTKTHISGVRDVNFKHKPRDLYENSKLLNISGKNQIRKRVFDATLDRNQNWTFATSGNVWTSSIPHNLSVNDTIKFIISGGGASGYSVNTTYYVKTVDSSTTVTLSTTEGGSVVTGSSNSSGNWKITSIEFESGDLYFSKIASFDGKMDYISIDDNIVGGSSATWTFDFTGGAEEDLWTCKIGETETAHNLILGDVINFIGDSTGVSEYPNTKNYFVVNIPSSTTCQLSDTRNGSVLEGTSDSTGVSIQAKRVPVLFGSDNWTISTWIKPTSLNNEMTLWVDSNSANDTNAKKLYIDPYEKNTTKFSYNGSEVLSSNCETKLNKWTHVTLTKYQNIVASGTAQSGGSSTTIKISSATTGEITDTAPNDYYNNMTIIITSGTGVGQIRTISGYANSTKLVTVSTLSPTTDTTSKYIIVNDIISLYIDGYLKAKKYVSMDDTTTSTLFRIGADRNGLYNFKGQMADFRVYDTQLNETEIKRLCENNKTIGPLIHYTFNETYNNTIQDMGSSGYNMKYIGASLDSDNVNVGLNCLKLQNYSDVGLVGHWLLNENNGKIANDISSNSNNGTLTGEPTWLSNSGPDNGPCLDFDGSNDFITLPTAVNSYFTGGNSFTISVWVYSTYSSSSGSRTIFSNRHSTSNYGFTLYAPSNDPSANKVSVMFREHSDAEMLTSSDSIETDKWFHITYTHKTNEQTIYINGVQNVQETNSRSFTNTPGTPQIGRERETYSFDGKMSDVRIYNRALTADEITNLYNKNSYCKINYNSVLGNYQFNKPFSIGLWFKKKYYTTTGTIFEFGKENASQFKLYIDSSNYHIYAKAGNSSNIIKTRYSTNSTTITTGTAQTGASSSITLASSDSQSNDYYNDSTITITAGTGVGQTRLITDYTSSSKVATVSAAWTTTPDDSSRYLIGSNDNTEWTHVCVVVLPTNNYSSTLKNVRIFVNGEDKTIYTDSTTFYNVLIQCHKDYKFTLGCNNKEARGDYFDGFIDDFRMYNVALTPNEIVELYYNKFNYSKI